MTEPNQNQLWRDLGTEELPMDGDRVPIWNGQLNWEFYSPGDELGKNKAWQRPANCNCPALREALQLLHDNLAEYQRINHLGGYDNHDMRVARAALAATPCTSGRTEEPNDEKHWGLWRQVNLVEYRNADSLGKCVMRLSDPRDGNSWRYFVHVTDKDLEADRDQWKGRAALAERDQTTPRCNFCEWTNVECLNVGEAGKPKWICHGCIKRELDKPQPAWIALHGPGSRKPTEQDCFDGKALLVKWNRKGFDGWGVGLILFHDFEGMATTISHFLPTKFTSAPDPDTAAFELKAAQLPIQNQRERDMARETWFAALAHRDAQQKARP